MIGAACNSRIPQANLHAVLNFARAKNCSQYTIHIEGTVAQNEQRLTKNFLLSLKRVVFLFVLINSKG